MKILLNLSDLSDESLQGQIIRQIRAGILAGEVPAGEDLPSIRGMARDQKVSVITVQRAYEQLEREGLIHSRRGKGFFASEIPREAKKLMALERLQENLKAPLAVALEEGLSPADINRVVQKILGQSDEQIK